MKRNLSLALVLTAAIVIGCDWAWAAQTGEDDEMFENAKPANWAENSKNRGYPGARDEQRLEIQASLPQPTRNADGTSTVLDEFDEPVTAPVSD